MSLIFNFNQLNSFEFKLFLCSSNIKSTNYYHLFWINLIYQTHPIFIKNYSKRCSLIVNSHWILNLQRHSRFSLLLGIIISQLCFVYTRNLLLRLRDHKHLLLINFKYLLLIWIIIWWLQLTILSRLNWLCSIYTLLIIVIYWLIHLHLGCKEYWNYYYSCSTVIRVV
ncbi:transmembrane protein, putative (macronuclear) [Tetrahymena thermophila SB210]|uniref:Transmembrane protein, putative n=1 Tax=Tetrahymena thermophila (strain SB210) TaxID=312017 RepID=W7XEP2_TETTS|nr:transmembrane protein, putative [Tetrahymena thermophila SB210]EWS75193.1 transmembrane protein, putative [Tetrahymena thermophila SB210]|eukprot:XP_012652184.1 transmembrane protein, putative [Tetrahymena thermophila SB210]